MAKRYRTARTAKRYLTYRSVRAAGLASKAALGLVWQVIVFGLVLGLLIVAVEIIKTPWFLIGVSIPLAALLLVLIVSIVRAVKQRNEQIDQSTAVEYANRRSAASRSVEIIQDCQQLVNDSASLDVVARRYKELIERMTLLSSYPEDELSSYGISFGKPIDEQLEAIEANKITIFNQAIDRSHQKCMEHVNSLKTIRGKEDALMRHHTKDLEIIVMNEWPSECVDHSEELYLNELHTLGLQE